VARSGKDSDEVKIFLTLFARLKEWSDDAPHDLVELANRDSSVKDLCGKLYHAANALKIEERSSRALFASPVDPKFLTIWRDFEHRYEAAILDAWISGFIPELDDLEPSELPKADLDWENANDEAEEQAGDIKLAIAFAWENANQEGRWDAEYSERVRRGIALWARLSRQVGLDPRGVLRRRALIPFVFIPRSIAAKHGSNEAISMLKNLQQAHEAFVFGATYSALALMRSIMEAVLRDHYKSQGKDLSERIDNARRLLPAGANGAALHRLRKLANSVLHLDVEKDKGMSILDESKLEKEIVSLLYALRALIEGV
jgi:hypothetical protein